MNESKVKLIIHGHFYQPPRENPWTNEIDNQSGAYPYKNWNYRVAAECYGPNAYSRVLDQKGMIKEIVNNYEYISFNFGPTLLSWLELKEPEVYKYILEADKKSAALHNGHGNGIAQVYNHVILPLQTFEDRKTQILWGLKDFKYRFGRDSEGVWLAETAVDYKTIDILIEYGIKFIILSPLQAIALRKAGSVEWDSVKKGDINSARPYKIVRSHGEIAVFFYDKELSTAASFEHLLRNADDLAYKVISRGKTSGTPANMVIMVTDGEIYGHHEPFGDMCLSSLIQKYCIEKEEIEFTNFGEYLESHQPEYEVTLYLGEDNLGSSWSCSHGVGRWYRNCGCRSGGDPDWQQNWRTPVRESFDILKKEIDRVYTEKVSGFVSNPWELRNSYIDFILSEYNETPDLAFIDRCKKRELTTEELETAKKLLEAEKFSMFMYTSCGWFFSELTGIETIQNIKYAVKALTLIEEYVPDIRTRFEEKLGEAKSNIQEYNDGRWIVTNLIYPDIQDRYHIANNYIALLNSEIDMAKHCISLCSSFSYRNYKLKKSAMLSDIYRGTITIIDTVSHIEYDYAFLMVKNNEIHYKLFIADSDHEVKLLDHRDEIVNDTYSDTEFYETLTEHNLLLEVKNLLLEANVKDTVHKVFNRNIESISDIKDILRRYREIDISLSSGLAAFVKNTVEIYLHKMAEELDHFPDDDNENEILSIFELLNYFGIKVDGASLKTKFSDILYKSLSGNSDPDSNTYSDAIKFINFTNKAGLIVEKSKLENRIFNILKHEFPALIGELNNEVNEDEKVKAMIKIRRIIMLAEIFNINTEEQKKKFFAHF